MKCLLVLLLSIGAQAAVIDRPTPQQLKEAFDKIKGCYWVKEDRLDPNFRTYSPWNKKQPCKTDLCREVKAKTAITSSMVTAVNNSQTWFDPETKKPVKEIYLSLNPGNQTPGVAFQLVVDPKSFSIKGDEIRGHFNGSILNRDNVGKTDEEIKSATGKPEVPMEVRQMFRVKGNNKSGIQLLISMATSLDEGVGAIPMVYDYELRPAKSEDCVNEDMIDAGLPKQQR